MNRGLAGDQAGQRLGRAANDASNEKAGICHPPHVAEAGQPERKFVLPGFDRHDLHRVFVRLIAALLKRLIRAAEHNMLYKWLR